MTNYTSVIKVTEYPPHLKHKTIFETYDSLQPSESMRFHCLYGGMASLYADAQEYLS